MAMMAMTTSNSISVKPRAGADRLANGLALRSRLTMRGWKSEASAHTIGTRDLDQRRRFWKLAKPVGAPIASVQKRPGARQRKDAPLPEPLGLATIVTAQM